VGIIYAVAGWLLINVTAVYFYIPALPLYFENQVFIKSTFSIKGVNYAQYHIDMYRRLNIISYGNQRSGF
jgi:hypothetical protein